MTNKKNSNEVITKITMDILEQLNLDQFEHIEQRTKMSGELNPYFNKDAVYFLGGIVNQIASLSMFFSAYARNLTTGFTGHYASLTIGGLGALVLLTRIVMPFMGWSIWGALISYLHLF